MAMVGLFWITEDSVYLGAEPVGEGTGVRLTTEGVETLEDERDRSWGWGEVRGIEVRGVPVRSAARRVVSMTFGTLYAALTGDRELPSTFTACVETSDGTAEVCVFTAVTGGIYTPEEYELSRALLGRLTDGGVTVADMIAWRREWDSDETPQREEREALLRFWAEGPEPAVG
ncbi:hypothetical protein [Streptomyces harbinensis]|uniref:hypothetical protein n=1 Tax=Streptomyces harbinensis TaxID=1176198 RepID=UPI001592715D|nr:hypothetical protein [Streptomyces harbinensis]QKV70642.1 hypothetical protein HUT13_19115 [Streptomyces harbinensis]